MSHTHSKPHTHTHKYTERHELVYNHCLRHPAKQLVSNYISLQKSIFCIDNSFFHQPRCLIVLCRTSGFVEGNHFRFELGIQQQRTKPLYASLKRNEQHVPFYNPIQQSTIAPARLLALAVIPVTFKSGALNWKVSGGL